MKEFKHVISLGYFCSPAQEIERIGLRDCSSPFDWLISSDFESVITLIDNNFREFLNKDLLLQDSNNPTYYFNEKYNIWFYHDFDGHTSLNKQIVEVQTQYKNRIRRFYNNIAEPTLFLRYISGQKELDFIEKNLIKINSIIKKFCVRNEIIFVANDELTSQIINIFNVKPDTNDTVARKFLNNNDILYDFLDKKILYDRKLKEYNYRVFRKKQKFYLLKKTSNKIKQKATRKLFKSYIHSRIYINKYKT